MKKNYIVLGLMLATTFVKAQFIEYTNYRGAFGANDTWANGWTNLDPQNSVYAAPNAIEDENNIEFASLMPNPANGRAKLNVALKQSTDLEIAIFDIDVKISLRYFFIYYAL